MLPASVEVTPDAIEVMLITHATEGKMPTVLPIEYINPAASTATALLGPVPANSVTALVARIILRMGIPSVHAKYALPAQSIAMPPG